MNSITKIEMIPSTKPEIFKMIINKGNSNIDSWILSNCILVTLERVDLVKLDEISWAIVEKQRKSSSSKTLSDDELFKLWQAFNKINIDNTVLIDIEEAALLLDEFMKAIGTPWTRGPLDAAADGKIHLTFWELVDCLESKYLHKTPKRNVFCVALWRITLFWLVKACSYSYIYYEKKVLALFLLAIRLSVAFT